MTCEYCDQKATNQTWLGDPEDPNAPMIHTCKTHGKYLVIAAAQVNDAARRIEPPRSVQL